MKICSFCQQLKLESEFIKDITQPHNLHQRCKLCEGVVKKLKTIIPNLTPLEKRKLLLKLYTQYNQFPTQLYRLFNCDIKYIYIVLKEEDIRRCKNCKEIKSFSEFYLQKRSEDGYNRWCKICAKNRSNDSMKKMYHNNPIHKQENNKKWRDENLDLHRQMMLDHYYSNKEQYRFNNRKRQQIKRHSIPPWANLQKIKELYIMARTLELLDNIPRHVDHIIPLQHPLVCGLHVETNLQILSESENKQKSNKFIPIYLSK